MGGADTQITFLHVVLSLAATALHLRDAREGRGGHSSPWGKRNFGDQRPATQHPPRPIVKTDWQVQRVFTEVLCGLPKGPVTAGFRSGLCLVPGRHRKPRFRRTSPSACPPWFMSPKSLPHLLLETPILLLDLGQFRLALGLQVRVLRKGARLAEILRPQQGSFPVTSSGPKPSPPILATPLLSPAPWFTFPSKISCFRLLISFFSSKCEASSFYREGTGQGRPTGQGAPLSNLVTTLTISHSLRTTLTCVRIFRTSASSTASSSSCFSAEKMREETGNTELG